MGRPARPNKEKKSNEVIGEKKPKERAASDAQNAGEKEGRKRETKIGKSERGDIPHRKTKSRGKKLPARKKKRQSLFSKGPQDGRLSERKNRKKRPLSTSPVATEGFRGGGIVPCEMRERIAHMGGTSLKKRRCDVRAMPSRQKKKGNTCPLKGAGGRGKTLDP